MDRMLLANPALTLNPLYVGGAVKYDLWWGIENEPGGNDILEALPSSPEGFDTRFAIGSTSKKAAEFGDGAYRFP